MWWINVFLHIWERQVLTSECAIAIAFALIILDGSSIVSSPFARSSSSLKQKQRTYQESVLTECNFWLDGDHSVGNKTRYFENLVHNYQYVLDYDWKCSYQPVVITAAIQRMTGSFQNEFWTFMQACPIQNDTNTRSPRKIDVSCCFSPLAKSLQTYNVEKKEFRRRNIHYKLHYTIKKLW